VSEESEKLRYYRTTVQSYEQELERIEGRVVTLEDRRAAVKALLKSAQRLLAKEQKAQQRRLKEAKLPVEQVPSPIEASRYAGMTLKEAIFSVLSKAQRPMHANEVLEELERGGADLRAKNPKLSIVSTLHRDKERYRKTAPNTFELKPEAVGTTQVPLLKN